MKKLFYEDFKEHYYKELERKESIMYSYYKDATTNNLLKNEQKVRKFTICTYFMGSSIILILISCVLLQFVSISEEPTSVHIENSIIHYSNHNKNPNPSPIGTRFGFLLFGAPDRT